ncbi:hypothetical protein H2200_005307 [Cladophialophora chaetospira]|uniref:Uncharacterized protein n=1 Tax=Cladophialophora chaetospira TaxID=386627 RepID=A0AA39CJH7_9EURO|nr:hypothetical protein H2200_005307 [Cladophialophora chaetospira]
MCSYLAQYLFALLVLPLLGLQLDDIITNVPPGLEQRMHNAVTDCIAIATLVSVAFSDCEPSYDRYFPRGDADFVQQVFRRIANIAPNAQLNVDEYTTVLDERARTGLDPRFDYLIINYGNHPQGLEQDCDGPDDPDGFFTRLFSGRPCICICPKAFRQYPDLSEILNPPAWARDARGHPLEGYGCDGLGDHEFLNDIPRYDDLINMHGTMRAITDYTGPEAPPEGYGPFYARVLQELSTLYPEKYAPHEAVNNADSFVVYAMSKFFSWRCGRVFGKPTSAQDNWNRIPPPRPP